MTRLVLVQTFQEIVARGTIFHRITTTVLAKASSMQASKSSNLQSLSTWLKASLTRETIQQWFKILCSITRRRKTLNFSYSNLLRELNKLYVGRSTQCFEPILTGSFLVVTEVPLHSGIRAKSLVVPSDKLNTSMDQTASSLATITQKVVCTMFLSRLLHADSVILAVWHRTVKFMSGDFQEKFLANKTQRSFSRNAYSRNQQRYLSSTASKEILAHLEVSPTGESRVTEIQALKALWLKTSRWANISLLLWVLEATSILGVWMTKDNLESTKTYLTLSNQWRYQAARAPFQKQSRKLTVGSSTLLS